MYSRSYRSTVTYLGLFFSKKVNSVLQQQSVVIRVPFPLLHRQQPALHSITKQHVTVACYLNPKPETEVEALVGCLLLMLFDSNYICRKHL